MYNFWDDKYINDAPKWVNYLLIIMVILLLLLIFKTLNL
jgi:hypothetical protein